MKENGFMNRPVRMKDIAKDLGVSVITVSKVLHNHSDISKATKERVLKRIQELDYQPNLIARSLASKRTFTVGLVVPDLTHTYYGELAKGFAHKVRRKGFETLISYSEEDPRVEKAEIERLLARRVDGLAVASCLPPEDTEMFKLIERRRVPYVLVARVFPGFEANFVGMDNEEVGRMATEHLIACGCRRIAHIRGPQVGNALGRMEGYMKALACHGLEMPAEYVVSGNTRAVTGGHDEMRQLLNLSPPPDGVFCYGDELAVGAMRALFEAGLRVPDDVALIGASNTRHSDFLRVPLTTIDQSSELTGELAGELLLKLMQSKRPRKPQTILVPPKLIVRESTMRQPVP
jgi:LacI family transcriptional regulator